MFGLFPERLTCMLYFHICKMKWLSVEHFLFLSFNSFSRNSHEFRICVNYMNVHRLPSRFIMLWNAKFSILSRKLYVEMELFTLTHLELCVPLVASCTIYLNCLLKYTVWRYMDSSILCEHFHLCSYGHQRYSCQIIHISYSCSFFICMSVGILEWRLLCIFILVLYIICSKS